VFPLVIPASDIASKIRIISAEFFRRQLKASSEKEVISDYYHIWTICIRHHLERKGLEPSVHRAGESSHCLYHFVGDAGRGSPSEGFPPKNESEIDVEKVSYFVCFCFVK